MRIIPYQPELAPYFDKLNKAWLEEYFVVEPLDKYVLENPEDAILKGGGKILFAEHEGNIIGTVALRRLGEDSFELTKMAVDKTYQGLGAGKLLCQAAIDLARSMGIATLILYTQSSLVTAIGIYHKLGFFDIPLEPGVYKRADTKMKIDFK